MEPVAKFLDHPGYLPEWATEIDEGVYSLGISVDPTTGEEVEGIAIVDSFAEDPHGNSPIGMTAKKSCWESSPVKDSWLTVEDWGFNGSGSGLSGTDIQATIEEAIEMWEGEITSGTDVLGSYTAGNSGVVGVVSDGENNIVFGDPSKDAIATTITYSSTITGEILEWDQIYESTATWSVGDPVTADQDLLNVAAHEIGHAMGLAHPGIICTKQTMHRWGKSGETKKRTLEDGDRNGINKQYP